MTDPTPARTNPVHVRHRQRIEADPAFAELLARKRRFIIPSVIFFVAYYFALPVLVGYFPGLMERRVLGEINLAYLFALSQFFMAWIIMALYVRKARQFDELARGIIQRGGASAPDAAGRA